MAQTAPKTRSEPWGDRAAALLGQAHPPADPNPPDTLLQAVQRLGNSAGKMVRNGINSAIWAGSDALQGSFAPQRLGLNRADWNAFPKGNYPAGKETGSHVKKISCMISRVIGVVCKERGC